MNSTYNMGDKYYLEGKCFVSSSALINVS